MPKFKTTKLTSRGGGQYGGISRSMLPSRTPKNQTFKLAPNSDGTNRVVAGGQTILERFEPVRAKGWRQTGHKGNLPGTTDRGNPGFTSGDPKRYNDFKGGTYGEGGFGWSGSFNSTGKSAARDMARSNASSIRFAEQSIKDARAGKFPTYDFTGSKMTLKEKQNYVINRNQNYITALKAEIFKVRTFSSSSLDNAWGKRLV